MGRVSQTRASGYLTSAVSVVLLGIPALKSAADDPAMLAVVVVGMGLSVAGMAQRWRAFRFERRSAKAKA